MTEISITTLFPALFSVSNKGGAGKSAFSKAMADFARRTVPGAALFDSDPLVGSLVKAYGSKDKRGNRAEDQNPQEGVGVLLLESEEDRNMLLDMVSFGAPLLLYDTAAGSMPLLPLNFGGDGQLFSEYFVQAGYRPVFVCLVDDDQASGETVTAAINKFGPEARYVVLRNHAKGRNFAGLDAGLAASAGALVLDMPALIDATMKPIVANGTRFCDAAMSGSPAARFQTAAWLKKMDAICAQILEFASK